MKTKHMTYSSLEDLERRKRQLNDVIQLENRELKRISDRLLNKDGRASRGEQLAQYLSYGAMVFDGVMTMRKLKKYYGSMTAIFKRSK